MEQAPTISRKASTNAADDLAFEMFMRCCSSILEIKVDEVKKERLYGLSKKLS
ncbi:MAG TPA: hypothetical protein VLX29_00985 [Nitrospirota bacterium]|nr:hypothetical protein [Nitrospirota bacterium]